MRVHYANSSLELHFPYNPTYNAMLQAAPNRVRYKQGVYYTPATIPVFEFLAQVFPQAEYTPEADEQRVRCRAILQAARDTRSDKQQMGIKNEALRERSYKYKPMEHQFKALDLSLDKKAFAFFMEQRTGKTKVVLDTTDILYEQGEIDALLVWAPNGVHINWATEEIPKHLQTDAHVVVWRSDANAAERKLLASINEPRKQLTVLLMNMEAMASKRGVDFARAFLQAHNALAVFDEGHNIKTPGAVRTKNTIAVARLAKYRRLLTGTPVTQGLEDLYSQFQFLDEQILGYTSFYAYKNRFCVQREANFGNSARPVRIIVGYQNVEELQRRVDGYSYDVRRKDCFDLPERMYVKNTVDMTKQQALHYTQLRDELVTLISNREITTPLAITKTLRLRQVLSGFMTFDDGTWEPLQGANPKLDALIAELETRTQPTIIWSVFRPELITLSKALGVPAYFGDTEPRERTRMVQAFQAGDMKYFVANPASAGAGLELTAAPYTDRLSNSYSLAHRLQSDDRNQGVNQKHSTCIYTDYVVRNTIEEKILQALRDKRDVASTITKEEIVSWL